MTDRTPTMYVETTGVEIEVTDQRTARLALEEVDRVLSAHLGDAVHVQRSKREYPAYDATCDKCGYEWEYKGKAPERTTCPKCTGSTKFEDAPLESRL